MAQVIGDGLVCLLQRQNCGQYESYAISRTENLRTYSSSLRSSYYACEIRPPWQTLVRLRRQSACTAQFSLDRSVVIATVNRASTVPSMAWTRAGIHYCQSCLPVHFRFVSRVPYPLKWGMSKDLVSPLRRSTILWYHTDIYPYYLDLLCNPLSPNSLTQEHSITHFIVTF